MFRVRDSLLNAIALSVGVLVLAGCSGVYYNTTFNAEKAHAKGLKLKADRLRLSPDDSVSVTSEERAQFQRAVIKSSKVLELWPDHAEYAPRAVYRIAECQYLMDDFAGATLKYDEFLRAFPEHENAPMARVRKAQAAFRDGKMLIARESLAEVMATNPTGAVRREALLLSAQMQVAEQAEGIGGTEALAVYEQLLTEGAFDTPEARNEIRWRAARLAFDLGQWEKARHYALAANEGTPPMRVQFRNRRLALLAMYELQRHAEGLKEVRAMQGQRPFRPYRPDLKLMEARGVQGQGDWPAAYDLYRATVRQGPRLATAAEAWYRLGDYYLGTLGREDSALVFFDSAAAAGRGFEFGQKGADLALALKRLGELRLMDSAHVAQRAKDVEQRRLNVADSIYRAGLDSASLAALSEESERLTDSLRMAAADSAARVAADTERGGRSNQPPKVVIGKPPSVQYAPFMIAELFHFRLPNADSARKFLNRIVSDTTADAEDTLYTRRAYYALAWLEANGIDAQGGSVGSKARADSLYRALMARYPATEWAKAAERNLGLPASVKTSEDSAGTLFVEAERLRFSGADVKTRVTPAYKSVITRHPKTSYAAKAQFVIAFLTEEAALAGRLGPPGRPLVDTVKAKFELVRDGFTGTPQAAEASRRLDILSGASDEAFVPSGDPRGGGGRQEDYYDEDEDIVVPRPESIEDSAEQDLY